MGKMNASQEVLEAKRSKQSDSRTSDKWRRLALYFGLAFVFTRFSYLHEMITERFGLNLYPLYIFGVPAIVGVFASGGLRRCLQFRPAVYWLCFAGWMIPTTLFSTWKGGSVQVLIAYYKADLVMLFVIGGLVVTWRECKALLFVLAGAATTTLVLLVLFGERNQAGRTELGLENGSISNSNDYAAHLILLLPFALWIALTRRSIWLRIAAVGVVGFGLYEILGAGSRGALIALVAAVVTYLAGASWRQRRFLLLAVPLAAVLAIAVLPSQTTHRMFSFWQSGAQEPSEALESSAEREQLLHDSILQTIRHPLLGLGPGQFANTEGHQITAEGYGLFRGAHNSYTQAGSEMGIPSLFFMLGGMVSCFLLLRRTEKRCQNEDGSSELRTALTWTRIAIVGFCISIFFLNFTYSYYLPTIVGITIALVSATQRILDERKDQSSSLRQHSSKATAARAPQVRAVPLRWG